MRRKTFPLAGVSLVAWFGVIHAEPLAHAQDAPPPVASPPATAPSGPSVAPDAPAPDAPAPAAPPSPSTAPAASAAADAVPPPASPPALTSSPPPASPTDGSAPASGSAAFAPLADDAKPPQRARSAPPASTAPPLADTQTRPAALDSYHHSAPIADAAPEPEHNSDDEGLFGPFRIGFLVGGGLPDLLSLGGQIKLTRYFGAGVNVGIIPTVKLSLYGQAKLSYQEYDLYGHIYPFGGVLFLGAGVGYATMKGSLVNSYSVPPPYNVPPVGNSVAIESQGSVRTLVLTPQIGLLKTFGPGFSIGLDVGAQVPIAPSQVDNKTQAPSYVPASQVKPYDDKVHSTLTTMGRQVLPTFNFKIGWLL